LEPLRVYIDSSYLPCGKSQSGCIYHCPLKNKQVGYSSEVYCADNSNNSELLGIYYWIGNLHEEYGIKRFKIFTDNIVCASMLDPNKKVNKRTLNRYPVLEMIIEYFKRYEIKVEMEKVSRRHENIKLADKLSKAFRHKEDKNDPNRI